MKILQIIDTAYRATMEEQDDTVVWITHAMRGAGGDIHALLRGNAVNYAVKGQNAAGLKFGDWHQVHPPQLSDDIAGLVAKGSGVYVVEEDLAERGLIHAHLVEGIQRIPRAGLARLLDAHDQIWHW